MTGPEGQIAQITRGLASIMAKRAALVAEIGVPAVTPTPRQAIPAPPEALNPTPPMGTVISIAPPPSRYQPVPVPPTGTAISIAPPPLSASLYRPYRRVPQSLLHRPPSGPAVPAPPTDTAISIVPLLLSVRLYQSYQRVRRPLLRRLTPNTDLPQPRQRQLKQDCRLPVEQMLQQPVFPG